jgi:hypothetical protein
MVRQEGGWVVVPGHPRANSDTMMCEVAPYLTAGLKLTICLGICSFTHSSMQKYVHCVLF